MIIDFSFELCRSPGRGTPRHPGFGSLGSEGFRLPSSIVPRPVGNAVGGAFCRAELSNDPSSPALFSNSLGGPHPIILAPARLNPGSSPSRARSPEPLISARALVDKLKSAGFHVDKETELLLFDLRVTESDVQKALDAHTRYNEVAARVAAETRTEEIPGQFVYRKSFEFFLECVFYG